MNIKRLCTITAVSVSMILSNINLINAQDKITDNNQKEFKSQITRGENIPAFKEIQINKTYKHEIAYNPNNQNYDNSLYIEFEIPETGYLTFKSTDLLDENSDSNSSSFNFKLGYAIESGEEGYLDSYKGIQTIGESTGKTINYKIGLNQGIYRVKLNPNFKVSKNNSIEYSLKFEAKGITDIEPNSTIQNAEQINLNTKYLGIFSENKDVDYYKFNNKGKYDIRVKIKSPEISANDKNEPIQIRLEKLNESTSSVVATKTLNGTEFDGEYFIWKIPQLLKGDYVLAFNCNGSKAYNYDFIVESDQLSKIDSIKGIDRYETAALIADKQNYKEAILVNSSNSLADGLSASGLSGAINAPILLTMKSSIPEQTNKRLNGVNKIYLIGSESSIDTNIENQLKSRGIEVKRLGGLDRYKTSYAVAKEISTLKKIDKILLVNGVKGEPDAMSVSSVASRDASPIILTDGNDIPFETNGVKSYIIGSTGVMSKKIEDKTKATRLGGIDRFDTNKKIIKHFYGQPTEFYLSKSDKLVDALTGSPLAKEAPIVLVNNGSDKSILNKAKKLTALGGIDKTIIEECINAVNSQ